MCPKKYNGAFSTHLGFPANQKYVVIAGVNPVAHFDKPPFCQVL
jgi:hypothetical protein